MRQFYTYRENLAAMNKVEGFDIEVEEIQGAHIEFLSQIVRPNTLKSLVEKAVFVTIKPSSEYGYTVISRWNISSEDDVLTRQSFIEGWWEGKEIDVRRCDMCNVSHRRNKGVIVQDKDGKELWLGGSCATNLRLDIRFNKLYNVMSELFKYSIFGNDEDEESGYGRNSSGVFELDYLLYLCYGWIDTYGYVPKSADMRQNTATLITMHLFDEDSKFGYDKDPVWGGDAKGYIRNLLSTMAGEIVMNCNQILDKDFISYKRLGLICWMVSLVFKKKNTAPRIAATQALDIPVGKSMDLPGVYTIYNVYTYENEYGVTHTARALDDQGNGIKFNVSYKMCMALVGTDERSDLLNKQVTVRGAAKEHNIMSKDTTHTMILRPKVKLC